jgi:hypothetical protein
MGAVLVLSGLIATIVAVWRGYALTREAVGPLVHQGDETRSLIETSRPLRAQHRVRQFVRSVSVASAWLLVALYGLYLATVGFELAG